MLDRIARHVPRIGSWVGNRRHESCLRCADSVREIYCCSCSPRSFLRIRHNSKHHWEPRRRGRCSHRRRRAELAREQARSGKPIRALGNIQAAASDQIVQRTVRLNQDRCKDGMLSETFGRSKANRNKDIRIEQLHYSYSGFGESFVSLA